MLLGLEAEADCELSCEKLRVNDVLKAAASGVILELASAREFASDLEAVEAARRVRDAIVSFGVSADDGYAEQKFHLHRRSSEEPRLALHNPSSTAAPPQLWRPFLYALLSDENSIFWLSLSLAVLRIDLAGFCLDALHVCSPSTLLAVFHENLLHT